MSTQSNLPPGVSVNDLPGWRPYNGPAEDQCHECGEEVNFDYQKVFYHGKLHCGRCVPHCEVCGENMGDENRLACGAAVDYGAWKGHAVCVAEATFDLDEWMTREAIAAVFDTITVKYLWTEVGA